MMRLRSRGFFVIGAAAFWLSACETSEVASPVPPGPATQPPDTVSVSPIVATEQTSRAAIAAAIDRALETRGPGAPAMWRYGDEDTTVHLFGTVHLLRPETEWRTPAFDAAFSSSDTLVLEVDALSPEAQAQAQVLIPEYGLFSDGTTLSAVLSDNEAAEVKLAASTVGVPYAALESFKPWLASLQLGLTQIQNAGFDPNAGLEPILTGEAQSGGKAFAFLETIDQQFAALGSAPLDEQVDGLILTALTIDTGADLLDTLVAEWADGDVAGLGAMVAEPAMLGGPAAYQSLIVDRNMAWAPQLKALLKEPGVKFVAVGAGHLVGPDSVIALLRGDGIEVVGPETSAGG